MNKIVIIGCGNVGMSYAYALLNQRTAVSELVLIDLDVKRIEGEVMDLNHCLAFAPSKIDIKVGTYKDCKDAKIICIAAGANQNPGETRMDLINKNSKIFKDIVLKVMETGFNGIFLIATNPLDVMTYLTWKYSNLPQNQIIGSGTSLDTSRLRYLVGKKLNISPKNIHAYVIGEHGDSEFVPWSNANVGLQKLTNFINDEELNEIYLEVKNAAYEIIDRKGATYYGIGMCLVRITNAILGNENSIITVSTYDEKNDIFMGLPTVINSKGVDKKIYVNLTEEETKKLQNCVNVIKKAIDGLNLRYKLSEVNSDLRKMIEEIIFPLYSKHDLAHNMNHVSYVIERSFKIGSQFSDLNPNILYTVAAFHDVGLSIDREEHELISAKIFYENGDIKRFFNDEECIIIKEAIEDHRASSNHEPRSIYGKIVAQADKNTDIVTSLKRTHLFTLNHYPNMKKEEILERGYNHIKEKFGENGYAKMIIQDDEYEKYLKDIRCLLQNKDEFIKMYEKINSIK